MRAGIARCSGLASIGDAVNVTDQTVTRRASVRSDLGGGSASTADLLAHLRHRAQLVHARGRVAEALYAVALDMFGDDADLHPAERSWLADALTTPVSEAAYEAVATLIGELAPTLGSAPPRVRPALARPPAMRRVDFE